MREPTTSITAVCGPTTRPAPRASRRRRGAGPLLRLALLAVSQLGACSAHRGGALDPAAAPATLLAELERRLLAMPSLRLGYTVTAEGAFSAALGGTLQLGGRSDVDLAAEGTFGGAPVTLHLRADARTMEGGSANRSFRDATPPALREALVLGLTRMGVLHNLARLTAGSPPDRSGGGVREWVEIPEVRRADEAGADPEHIAIEFPIHVTGTRAAEATLWLDRRTGLPVRREQRVTFPNGTMRVVERYEFLPQAANRAPPP